MRKLLNTLYVTSENSYLALDGENLVVYDEKKELGRLPLYNLDGIVSFGYRGTSPALMGACAERNISLCYLTPQGKFLARVTGKVQGNVLLREQQYKSSKDDEISLTIAKNCIMGKVYNARWVLERAIRDHGMQIDVEGVKKASLHLKESLQYIQNAESKDQLRGYEGEAASIYFGVFNELILQQKKEFNFQGRNKRPPKDNVNAMLSFVYTLLTNQITSALEIRQDIREFIEADLGYEAILSEYDSFPIDSDKDTINNCLRVVEQRADIMVLIVGSRYGYITDHGEKSITNLEYLRAKAKGIPIFVFIDQKVSNILPVWKKNKEMNFSDIVDSEKIFEFVDTLRNKDSNWVYEFNTGQDIIKCLKNQLAYLVNDSLCLRKHFSKEGVSPKVLKYSGRVFELVVEKPALWEYLLFAEVLKDNLNKLDDLRYDMKYGISFERTVCFENPIEIFDYVQAKSKELIRKNDILCVILNKALKEALGERGTPGNAEYIIYVAEKLIEVYKSDHLWALDFKCISVPEMFEKLIEYTSELSKSIIEDIENFIDDYDKRINELSYGLEDISGEKVVSFNLELRSPDMNKIDAEIKRLGKILLNN